jgi:hypothetical protein
LLLVLPASAHAAAGLRAGAGRADITPQTGYYLGGWTRADTVSHGQQTRLFARTIVLQRGGRKLALVSVDLFMIPGGMVKQIGDRLKSRGFSERNILVSASHTHSGPGGYANYPTLNTAAPGLQTATDPMSFVRLLKPEDADPALYRFLLEQIEASIVRADEDRAPAVAGWGYDKLLGITQNRSIEAHLANFGIVEERGEGNASQAPGGYPETVDPDVNVLRVDKLVRRGKRLTHYPIGAWSTFADHGTVTKATFSYYNADHHGSATRVFESSVRKAGTPPGQEVVNVYGNSDEGDMSAGLVRSGPAASDYVGRTEARSMLRAWKRAGRSMSHTPAFEQRWTRTCFCGQEVEGGQVASSSEVGLPFITGSEEQRGPLYDVTGVAFEGYHQPLSTGGPQGDKWGAPGAGDVPARVPLLSVRIGSRLIVTVPGEPTKQVGTQIKEAVGAAVKGSGIDRVVVSGLANEFVLYFTTPEEYDQQHYEGGNTHFGRVSANLIKEELVKLSTALVQGKPAAEPYPFDPTNGIEPTGPAYGPGASSATLIDQPAEGYRRFQRATIAWQGGPNGLDRPVDRAFVVAERLDHGDWQRVDDDLGLAMMWKVDANGRYDAAWEIPRNAPTGTYRLRVTAKRYELISRSFTVQPSQSLTLVPAGDGRFRLRYPPAERDVDLTWRPEYADGGRTVTAAEASDRYGNTSPPG